MQYSHLPPSKPAPRRPKNAPVYCVGWRAFVNWPQPIDSLPRPVPMLDATGKPIANDLTDGQELEIISWRPRAREGVIYQVRRTVDRSEWWIGVDYLRRQAQPTVEVSTLQP